MRIFVSVLFVLLTLGCGRSSTQNPVVSTALPSTGPDSQEKPSSVAEESESWSEDEKRIAETARKAVAENDSWVDRTEFRKPERQSDGSWHVLVMRTPYQPGGHRYITIDAEGKVAEYGRGK